jgi:hypothetical protein
VSGRTDMYCGACGQDSAALLAQVADLKRRIRLAKKFLLIAHNSDPIVTGTTAWAVLDLRRPLPKVRR